VDQFLGSTPTFMIAVTSGRKPNPEGFIDQSEDGNS
jgi:hypothetical protein